MKVVIALGSNLGDRRENLNTAITALQPFVHHMAVSSFHETDPVGGPEQPDYLNAVLVGETHLNPEELLQVMQEIENQAGRTREIRWGARTLDLDLIVAGDVIQEDPFLTLPHPRAHERGFVLQPWVEIEPDASIPGKGKLSDLLALFGEQE
ncbi:MAG: hypothetical protein RL414_1069 [Actinomycetota bacterium]|jgi:2-amino-4-hydroxy-6-hydroxymethyldihydropteridine diphosphokinase